jgi:hypothetical protein
MGTGAHTAGAYGKRRERQQRSALGRFFILWRGGAPVYRVVPLLRLVAAAQAFVTGLARVTAAHRLYLNAVKVTVIARLIEATTGNAAANRLAAQLGLRHCFTSRIW